MLAVKDLSVKYGIRTVLHNVSINVLENKISALVGANTSGKSTIAKAIAGTIPIVSGQIEFNGQSINDLNAYQRARTGVVLVPEGRGLFSDLTVHETLIAASAFAKAKSKRKENIEFVYDMFPRLKERQNQIVTTMSGGERQMLAIARGLMSCPTLLILDEPSLGLAPQIVNVIYEKINQLAEEGLSILLIEQNLETSLKYADLAFIIENGQIVLQGPGPELLNNPKTRDMYLGIEGDTNAARN